MLKYQVDDVACQGVSVSCSGMPGVSDREGL